SATPPPAASVGRTMRGPPLERSGDGDVDGHAADERLQDDAVALRQPEQRHEVVFPQLVLEVEGDADLAEPDRRLPVDRERAAEVEVALHPHRAADREPERRRHRAQRHAGARRERLEQHVAGAGELAGAARRRMQARFHERPARRHRADDSARVEPTLGAQRHERRLGLLAVALLQRRLQRLQLVALHAPNDTSFDPDPIRLCPRSNPNYTRTTDSEGGRCMTATSTIDAERLQELRAGLAGTVLEPGDDGYEAARRVHNGLIDRRPALIARCRTASD